MYIVYCVLYFPFPPEIEMLKYPKKKVAVAKGRINVSTYHPPYVFPLWTLKNCKVYKVNFY